jgi:hypothetical protein
LLVDPTDRNSPSLSGEGHAYAWQEQLESGQFEDLEDIAKVQGVGRSYVGRSYVGRMLQLTSLAPDIVDSILEGQAFSDISLPNFRKGIPVSWDEQRQALILAE